MNFINDIFNIFLPETALLITVLLLILLAVILPKRFYKVAKWVSIAGLVLATSLCAEVQIDPLYSGFSDAIISDNYTLFFKLLILISAFLIIFLTPKTVRHKRHKAFQFYSLFLTAVLSAVILVSVNDFLTMLVMLETFTISSYFLIMFSKGYVSKEASFKYLVTNAVATSVFLFGVSYMYGLTQSFNFNDITNFYSNHSSSLLYTISGILIVCGLVYKLGVLPFANWILDVYEGAPTSITTFLSVVPKVAMFAIVTRLLVFPLSYSFELYFTIIILTLVSALWANTLAIRQQNIKRLMACSSAANAAYILLVASLVSVYNLSTVLFYILTYIFMNVGIFAGIIILENSGFRFNLVELKNLAFANSFFTLAFSICIFALAGFPITSGFVAKIYLFSAIAHSGVIFIPFLIILFVAITIAAFYYFKIIKFLFQKSENNLGELITRKVSSAAVVFYFCAAITILLGIFPSKIIELCQFISYNI